MSTTRHWWRPVLITAVMSGALSRKVAPGRTAQRIDVPQTVPYKVELRTVDRIASAIGTIRAVHETAVASRLLARVKRVHVSAGQRLNPDDVIVELDQADIEARIKEAEANIDAARSQQAQTESDLTKVQQLRSQGAATARELTDAQRAVEVAQANAMARRHNLEQAQAQLVYATVRSPIAGVVIDKFVEQGDMAQPGKTLVTLYDPDRLQLVASVPERLAVRLKVGQSATVRVDALDMDCQGHISEIVPQASPTSRSMLVKVTGPCEQGVYSGMFGRLLIVDGTRQQLLIPTAAVRRVGQLELVQVLAQDHDAATAAAATQRFVRTGETVGEFVEVLAGLAPGETVNATFGRPSRDGPHDAGTAP
jgi:membrane fusion protein (multidrug efflux system)